MSDMRYGTDLVTFYSPAWWGFRTDAELLNWARDNPKKMWTRILDGLGEAGISIVEMTFAPADRHSIIAAFGSTAGFIDELRRRGLSVLSGFLLIQSWYPGDDMESLLTDAVDYVAFLSDIGASYIVVGLPIRRDLHLAPAETVDDPLLKEAALVLDHLAALAARHGIGVAVHTEAHSIVGSTASIDAIMSLTRQVDLCVDSAQLILANADPAEVVSRHATRIALAHWKDADGPMEPAPPLAPGQIMHDLHFAHMRKIGHGVVNWQRWNAALQATRAHSVRLIELDATPHPVTSLIGARHILQQLQPVT